MVFRVAVEYSQIVFFVRGISRGSSVLANSVQLSYFLYYSWYFAWQWFIGERAGIR